MGIHHNPQVEVSQHALQLTFQSDIRIMMPKKGNGWAPMALHFSAEFQGKDILCHLRSDTALVEPVLCFSMMSKPQVLQGGALTKSVAGYAEVTLPSLGAGAEHSILLAAADQSFYPRNRAWMPLSPFLRVDGVCHALPPPTPLGVLPFGSAETFSPSSDDLPLVPPPENWRPQRGFLMAPTFDSSDSRLKSIDALSARLGFGPFLSESGVVLTIQHDLDLPAEAYRVKISTDAVEIVHGDARGLHNAAITLLNLRETTTGRIPCGLITDSPRFSYRGQHLDCARHFFSVNTILRLLDLMALLKLNRFHWHFADDEAFRLEVDCFPELWQKTAYRGEDEIVPGVFGGGIRAGGSYSKADVATVLARAAELHIEVLPEIEVPAHCYAINKVIPGLRDPADIGLEVSIQGYSENILNPAMDETWHFLKTLCAEVAALFPGATLHLGGDELPPGAWSGSPAVAALKQREGLVASDDVQGWMMQKLAAHLTAHGVRSAAWEEAAKGNTGGIGNNALLFSWTGQGPGIAAARRGHDVVMCPAQHVYLDHTHSEHQQDWGAAWAGITPFEKTVEWDPVPRDAPDIADRVIGIQGCFWAEFTTEDWQLEAMLAPRILGVACKAWEQDRRTSGKQLRNFAFSYASLFERMSWKHRTLV
jgi:hexosaminidase